MPDTPRFHNRTPGRVYSSKGLCPTLRNKGGDGVPYIIEEEMDNVKDKTGNRFKMFSKSKALIETIEKNTFMEEKPQTLDLFNRSANERVAPTLKDPKHNDRGVWDGVRIRRLTPKECWRLMGFSDEDFEKARAVNSDTQLYKQAGNSIVVDVLVAILRNLLTGDREEQEIQRELW